MSNAALYCAPFYNDLTNMLNAVDVEEIDYVR